MFQAFDRIEKNTEAKHGGAGTPPRMLVCGVPPAGAHRMSEMASLNEILCIR